MADSNGNKHWTEHFRIITPILVTIAVFELGNLISIVNKLDDKIFKHLTNDEIHCARSLMTSKAEFQLYQEMRDKQMGDLKDNLRDIKSLLERHMETNNGR